jgi:hypothetical protein
MTFNLRFPGEDISYWASRYFDKRENNIENVIAPRFRAAGYLLKDDFMALCEWKSPRPRMHYARNSEDFIREVTKTALSSKSENLRIEVLTLLRGVSWPVASAILHFGFENLYPIMDFRALWSSGIDTPAQGIDNLCNFGFWENYTSYCRSLASEYGVSMRTLDRALWQYSKEQQSQGSI